MIAGGYLRVARARGLGARVLPYVLTGVGARPAVRRRIDGGCSASTRCRTPTNRCRFVQVLLRLLDPTGVIGLALLVLAWLERHVALLLFALVYLAVVLVPINFGWGVHWGGRWEFAPSLVISGGVLLLGSAGFALAQRLRQPR